MFFCLLMTVLICASCFYATTMRTSEPLPNRLLMTFLLACAQIVGTELLLGITDTLYLTNLVVLNLMLATVWVLIGRRPANNSFAALLRSDIAHAREAATASFDIPTALLALIVVLTYGWILLAASFLPPRGIDDLAYHLPPVYEYIRSHQIRLLPVQLRPHFAFPQNAELLYLWPTIFAGNQRWVDALNIPFVVMSVLTVHLLLRKLAIPARDSLCAALLYALCPVVIMQAGVNYIEIIVTLFLLLGLYFSLSFHAGRSDPSLYAAAVAIGLLFGMKYFAALLVLPLLPLLVPGLVRGGLRSAALSLLPVIGLGGWWYLRNHAVLHDPFHPLNLLGTAPGTPGHGSLVAAIAANSRQWATRYLVNDIGIGSYDGGFGLVFWGIGFPSWLYLTLSSLVRPRETGLPRLMTLAYLPVGFLLLFAVPAADVPYTARFALFIVPTGLFAFGRIMTILDDKAWSSVLKTICILMSVLTLSLMVVSRQPTYRITEALRDRLNGARPSEFKYLKDSIPTQAYLRYLWEPLDYLTRDDRPGLACYLMGEHRLFAPAPVYGSNLQNRLLYSWPDTPDAVDAIVYAYYASSGKNGANGGGNPPPDVRLNGSTGSWDIVAGGDFVQVSHSPRGCLLLRRRIVEDPAKRRLLREYYREAMPEALAAGEAIAPFLREEIPVITSNKAGYGLRLAGRFPHGEGRILVTPEHMEEMVADRRHVGQCYTLDRPLAGYRSTRVETGGNAVRVPAVFMNWKP